ncbi:hypothetical protein GCM10010493_55380 [Streptomyces lavendulae subsp. grasserius]
MRRARRTMARRDSALPFPALRAGAGTREAAGVPFTVFEALFEAVFPAVARAAAPGGFLAEPLPWGAGRAVPDASSGACSPTAEFWAAVTPADPLACALTGLLDTRPA